jgi:hypothetical protein
MAKENQRTEKTKHIPNQLGKVQELKTNFEKKSQDGSEKAFNMIQD